MADDEQADAMPPIEEGHPDRRPATSGIEKRIGARKEVLWPMVGGVWLKIVVVDDEITVVYELLRD